LGLVHWRGKWEENGDALQNALHLKGLRLKAPPPSGQRELGASLSLEDFQGYRAELRRLQHRDARVARRHPKVESRQRDTTRQTARKWLPWNTSADACVCVVCAIRLDLRPKLLAPGRSPSHRSCHTAEPRETRPTHLCRSIPMDRSTGMTHPESLANAHLGFNDAQDHETHRIPLFRRVTQFQSYAR
jgi:hypothetical protein